MCMCVQTPIAQTPEAMAAARLQAELDERNKPLTDDDLDAILPSEGYQILVPPESYKPIRTPARKITATPTPLQQAGYAMPTETKASFDVPMAFPEDLPMPKPGDEQFFAALMKDVDESQLSKEEVTERTIMRLLLKVKNGTPPQRKTALRQLTDKARTFGAGPLFNQILPLLMSPTLEDQERHLLVKVIDRILFKLDDLVRPYVHKILVVIEPLLIDEDYYAVRSTHNPLQYTAARIAALFRARSISRSPPLPLPPAPLRCLSLCAAL
jgi:splicing factor 3B subunit 1